MKAFVIAAAMAFSLSQPANAETTVLSQDYQRQLYEIEQTLLSGIEAIRSSDDIFDLQRHTPPARNASSETEPRIRTKDASQNG
ncbi:hypothetical protein [Consotaella salsifontis]|uniref:hypothetical protein n=1 Tax=Consotaella salsifontis TaxID=1365950 RepID=UPI001056D53A|nr:hypothetical protein [Consotaella salsifontis]